MPVPDRGLWLLAAPFLLLALWCLFGWARHAELHCLRDAGDAVACTFTSARLIGSDQRQFDDAQLATAALDVSTSVDQDGFASSYRRVVLHLDSGDLALTSFGEARSEQLLAQIHDFSRARRPAELRWASDSRWFAYPMALFWLCFGAFILRPQG